jgi:hypothetical protein
MHEDDDCTLGYYLRLECSGLLYQPPFQVVMLCLGFLKDCQQSLAWLVLTIREKPTGITYIFTRLPDIHSILAPALNNPPNFSVHL